MKKIVFIIAMLALAFFIVPQIVAAQNSEAELQQKLQPKLNPKPKLKIAQPVFAFESVPEGEYITHEFKLTNTGDTLIKITDVRPP